MTTTREEQRDVVERLRGFDESDFYERPWSAHETMCESAEVIEELRAEITRLRASQAAGVPAGWKLVPIAPTPKMVEDAHMTVPGVCDLCLADVEDIYETMLSASPPPPATDGEWKWQPGQVRDLHDLKRALELRLERAQAALARCQENEPLDRNYIRGQLQEIEVAQHLVEVVMSAPATDGDALREALDLCLTGGNHIATVLIGRLGGGFAGPLSPDASHEFARARIADQDTYEIWCCWSALMRAREMAEAKAALASVPTPVSDGDSVLRKAVALVITHHVNQNRQKRRPESDSFTLKTLREALAATPVSATDAVEAERRLREALAPLAAFATFMDKDAPDEAYLPATVPHISLTLGQARAAATLLGFPHASDDPQFNGERLAAIRSRGTDEVENG